MTVGPNTYYGPEDTLGWMERIILRCQGYELALVNEHKCPVCEKWDHEYDAANTWTYEDASQPTSMLAEIKTCGNCGYESRWFDTGFMGVRGCLDDRKPKHGAFYHILPRSRR